MNGRERFKDKVLIVTGAAQGIGRGVAQAVCAEGGKNSAVSAKQRDAYVAALELRMAQLCGHR